MKKSLLLWLTLFIMTGSMLAACSGNKSDALSGDWKLTAYGSPANPTPAAPDVETSLTFGTDGKVNGNVGCNSFSGEYKVSGETITFGQMMSTLMGCMDPVGQQEGVVFNVLTNTATFKLDGDTLTITSTDGDAVVILSRK